MSDDEATHTISITKESADRGAGDSASVIVEADSQEDALALLDRAMDAQDKL
jgi:hypothetical protein